MGKRSRKRGSPAAPESATGTTRAERDAARARRVEAARRRSEEARPARRSQRRGRPTIDERPEAPWGKFPLTELVVLLALILLPLSFVVGGVRGDVMLTAALALGSLAGLEIAQREHFAGYRSHTSLLAGACAFVAMGLVFLLGGKSDVTRALMIPAGGVVFLVAFWFFREAFKRRSGGLGFR